MEIKLREECNRIIRSVVTLHSSIYPELRYIQNLWALGIIDNIDRFYEEPYNTIVRILPKIINLVNEQFPEKPTISHKLERINIIYGLETLKLVERIGNFKIVLKVNN